MQTLHPICLFTYKRLDELNKTITALKKNHLAKDSELYLFSDGAADNNDRVKVEAVRTYLKQLSGFKRITLFESETNKGLAESVIQGISSVLQKHGSVIVMEDDLITSPNFLDFMNQALNFYAGFPEIVSISGYSMNLPSLENYPYDFYLGYRAGSWGWGIWKDRWDTIDWSLKDYPSFKWNFRKQIQFMRGGSDMPLMLYRQYKGRANSWAIRLGFHQFKQNTYTIFPSLSKVYSIGFGVNATNTKNGERFKTAIDPGIKRRFEFSPDPKVSKTIVREFKQKFSVCSRIKNQLKTRF